MSKHVLLIPSAFALSVLLGCGDAPTPIRPGETTPPPAPAPAPATPAPAQTPAPAPSGETKADAPATPAPAPKEELKPAPAIAGGGQEMVWGRTAKFTMTTPADWKQEASGGMRQLQVRIPKVGADTEDAEMVGFIMPGGGGADANIQRWISQMGGESSLKGRKNVKTAAGADAVVAELEGTYSAMSPRDGSQMPPKAGYKMLGVFVGTPNGEVYLKLTGPKETVEAQKAAFEKMVDSFK